MLKKKDGNGMRDFVSPQSAAATVLQKMFFCLFRTSSLTQPLDLYIFYNS
jgi:hypothetical protein